MKQLLAVLLGSLCLAGTGFAQAADSWCVAVWYPSSEHPGGAGSILQNAGTINIVHPFWFTPRGDGTILSQAGSGWQEQVSSWREAGMLVMPSVFSTLHGFLAEGQRSAHLAELLALADEHDFDGLDIDYEMFPFSTRDSFSSFIEELAAGLHDQGRLLAVTVHAKTSAETPFESANAQDWPRLAAAADIFNLMTYDYTNRNEPPGPVASIAWVQDVLAYAVTAVDPAKLRVGLPFYGYSWTRSRPPAVAVTWEAAERMVTQFQLEPERHADSQELKMELNVKGLPGQQVFVSDAATTAARLEALAKAGQLAGGVAVWGLGGEDPGNWLALAEARPSECRLQRPQPVAREQ
jgi:hypothetical protein